MGVRECGVGRKGGGARVRACQREGTTRHGGRGGQYRVCE
jgi:hypothetical protein